MTRQPPTTEIRIVLRTVLSAGALAVLVLACAGAAWVVDNGGGTGVDFCDIQAAVDAAGAGDSIEVRSGRYEGTQKNQKDATVIQNSDSKSMFWAGLYHKKQKVVIYERMGKEKYYMHTIGFKTISIGA